MKALLPVATGNESEFCALVDVLRRARIDVTVASVEACEMVVLQQGLRIVPDAKLENVANEAWDAIVMPGGVPGDESWCVRIAEVDYPATPCQWRSPCAICLSPALVLKPAGVLERAKR